MVKRRRLLSAVEWAVALLVLLGLVWLGAGPVRNLMSSRPRAAAPAAAEAPLPEGVPVGASRVPLLVLLDGREVRVGDTQAELNAMLPERLALGPAVVSRGRHGDRLTRGYDHEGTQFYVVCERTEPGGAVRVAGIYLP